MGSRSPLLHGTPSKQTSTPQRGQSPSSSLLSQQMVTAAIHIQLTIFGRTFSTVSEAWSYLLTLPEDRHYNILFEFTRPMLKLTKGVDKWLETAFTEVERLKKCTQSWKEREFREKWMPVEQRAKRIRETRAYIRQHTQFLCERHH
jgi:hypothetical protein